MASAVNPRLCVLATSYPRFSGDDSSVFVKRLVEALARSGAGGVVIVPRDGEEPAVEPQGSFRVERYRYGIFSRGSLAFGAGIAPNIRAHPLRALQAPGLIAGMALRAWRLREQYDVVLANWAPAGLAAWINRRICGRPYVVVLRGEDARLLKSPWLKPLFRRILRGAEQVLAVSRDFVDLARRDYGISGDRSAFIPNGVSLAEVEPAAYREFLARRALQPDIRYLLFIGTVVPRKRIEILLQALALPGLAGFRLIVCGRTDNREYVARLHALADGLGVSRRVTFAGMTDPAEIPCFLKLAHCYVSASEFEGRSNSLLEAAAAGKVILASRIAAHAEIIRDGENGLLFEDAAELGRRLESVERDADLRRRLSAAAARLAGEHSWERCAEEYLRRLGASAAGQKQSFPTHAPADK